MLTPGFFTLYALPNVKPLDIIGLDFPAIRLAQGFGQSLCRIRLNYSSTFGSSHRLTGYSGFVS